MGKRRSGLVRVLNKHSWGKCGISKVKHRFALEKVQIITKLKEPYLNHAQSLAGSLQWAAQMRPWLRPFRGGLHSFCENRGACGENWQRIIDYNLKIWGVVLKYPRFIAPESFLGNKLKVGIYTDACAKSPPESDSINRADGIGIGWILVVGRGES